MLKFLVHLIMICLIVGANAEMYAHLWPLAVNKSFKISHACFQIGINAFILLLCGGVCCIMYD